MPPKPSSQEALIKAYKHPVRAAALVVFAERTVCASELAEILGMELKNVTYHVRVLADLELIEPVKEQRLRGSIATYYKAVTASLTKNVDWERLNPAVREAVSGRLLEGLISDASASLSTGAFDDRPTRHLSRTSIKLDDKGWRQVAGILEGALEAILREQGAAGQRLKDSGEPGISASVNLLFFEKAPNLQPDDL
jgi:DNA-binding transcriptional ArsR family regulator